MQEVEYREGYCGVGEDSAYAGEIATPEGEYTVLFVKFNWNIDCVAIRERFIGCLVDDLYSVEWCLDSLCDGPGDASRDKSFGEYTALRL